ncbi:MAG: DUF2723 domain-containing protein, partial [Chloroflexota bacterium]|nr:DUF2723 domain-containing protein [Chloroflexota bacterium]
MQRLDHGAGRSIGTTGRGHPLVHQEQPVGSEEQTVPRSSVLTLHTRDALLTILVGLLAFVLYWQTLAPGVVTITDDSLEFQLVAQRGAIPHPTGYPLYAILLTLSARLLPIGEVAFRANLLSALAASGAVALTFLVARRLQLQRLAAFFAAALLALSPTFWSQATLAEVYALHILIVAAVVYALLRWEATPASHSGWFAGAAFLFGLGLAHHQMILLWAPAIFLYWSLVADNPGLAFRNPTWLLALFAPLLLYLWLPLRAEVGSIDGTYDDVGFGCWVRACQY